MDDPMGYYDIVMSLSTEEINAMFAFLQWNEGSKIPKELDFNVADNLQEIDYYFGNEQIEFQSTTTVIQQLAQENWLDPTSRFQLHGKINPPRVEVIETMRKSLILTIPFKKGSFIIHYQNGKEELTDISECVAGFRIDFNSSDPFNQGDSLNLESFYMNLITSDNIYLQSSLCTLPEAIHDRVVFIEAFLAYTKSIRSNKIKEINYPPTEENPFGLSQLNYSTSYAVKHKERAINFLMNFNKNPLPTIPEAGMIYVSRLTDSGSNGAYAINKEVFRDYLTYTLKKCMEDEISGVQPYMDDWLHSYIPTFALQLTLIEAEVYSGMIELRFKMDARVSVKRFLSPLAESNKDSAASEFIEFHFSTSGDKHGKYGRSGKIGFEIREGINNPLSVEVLNYDEFQLGVATEKPAPDYSYEGFNSVYVMLDMFKSYKKSFSNDIRSQIENLIHRDEKSLAKLISLPGASNYDFKDFNIPYDKEGKQNNVVFKTTYKIHS